MLSGYDYEIHSLLYDNVNWSENINTFDGQYSFKQKDGVWTKPADYCWGEYLFSGDNDYFDVKVEPILDGYLGSYKLKFTLLRTKKTISALEEFTEDLTTIYPVPNNGSFTLKLGNDHIGANVVKIYDISGKMVYYQLIENPSEITKDISLNLPNGIYLIKVNNKNRSTTEKIIVNK